MGKTISKSSKTNKWKILDCVLLIAIIVMIFCIHQQDIFNRDDSYPKFCRNMDLNPLNYPNNGTLSNYYLLETMNVVEFWKLDLPKQASFADEITTRYAKCESFCLKQALTMPEDKGYTLLEAYEMNVVTLGNLAYLILYGHSDTQMIFIKARQNIYQQMQYYGVFV